MINRRSLWWWSMAIVLPCHSQAASRRISDVFAISPRTAAKLAANQRYYQWLHSDGVMFPTCNCREKTMPGLAIN